MQFGYIEAMYFVYYAASMSIHYLSTVLLSLHYILITQVRKLARVSEGQFWRWFCADGTRWDGRICGCRG